MNKLYMLPTLLTAISNPKTKDKILLFFYSQFAEFMKKNYSIFVLSFFLFFANDIFSQVSYLGLDGGLEGSATIDNTVQAAPGAGAWRKNNASQTIANETGTVRSGVNSLRVNNNTTTGRRVWSPNFTIGSTTSNVTVQFYKYVANITNAQDEQRGIINNTEGLSGTYNSPANVAGTWVKVTYTKASSTFTTISGLFLHRQIGTGGDMFIDDMAVYTGAVDVTAPSAATSAATANPTTSSLDVSWIAASGGVDGGGYIVVRGLVDPTTAPNVNGIYAVGNTIAAGMTVVYRGTGTSFTDAGLSSSTQYFYRVYTYDKAYNYASAATCNGTTTSSGAPTVTIDNTGAPAAGNIVYNTNNVLIGGFRLTPSASINFTALNITTSGTAATSDISNFDLIYDADNSGTYNGGDAVVASVPTLANPLVLSGFTETFSSARRYLIIADVAAAATDGRTITASISAASNVTTTGTESGTATGNTQTIQAPEMRVEGNSIEIVDGDITPIAGDHTAFGNIEVGQILVRTFTIRNIGNQNLNLSGVPIVSITGSSQFVVTTQPSATTVSGPSGSLTFQVTYTPTTYNTQTATISITNNDGNENPYNFDINGTGTSSSLSDIVLSGMVYTSNIDYTAFQAPASLTNTSGNVGVMGITIRDGGTSSPDNDGLPTILTGITFSGITGTSMIRTAALFDGNAMVANVPTISTGANTIAFSGLSYSCTDNSTRDLTLRISFLTTVTDNLQMTFSVTNANVTTASSATSSQMTAFTTVNSSTTGDRNRIEVSASKLAFLQQPSNTSINATMSPAPTVRALDINNILDLDYTTNISISSSGTMTGDPISVAASAGVATFSSVVHTVSGTGYILTASSGGFSTVNSNTFDITNIVFVDGDYRTIGSGSWVSNNASPAIWERRVSGSWVPNNSPTYSTTNNVYIQNGHTITSGGSFGSSVNLKILQGGTFNCNHPSTTASTYIYDGGTLNVNASFTMAIGGSFEVEDNGNVNINFEYGTPASSIWQGVEDFHPNSNLTLTDWDAANDIFIPDNTSITTNTYNGYTAAFGNIILDFGDPSSLGASDDMIFLASGDTINMAHGDLIFRTNNVIGADMRISTTGTVTSGIGGDFIVEDSYYVTSSSNFIQFKTSGTLNFTIKGNMTLDQATTRLGAGTNPITTLNIDGNLEIYGGAFFDMQSTVAAGNIQTINLKGDLYVTTGGRISCSNSNPANNIFNFTGPGDGLSDATTQTIDNASTSTNAQDNMKFYVKPGAYVKLINRDFQLGSRDTFYVQGTLGNEGVLDFGYNGTSGWLVKERTSAAPTGTTAFRLEQNGILKITHQNGIVTAATADGNVQTDVRTFDAAATYHYIGKQNQFTGNALPSASSAKVVICDMETNTMTLTMSGTTAVSSTASVDATYGGHLYVKKGQLIETTSAFFTSGSGTLRMEPGTLYYIPAGSADTTAAKTDLIPRMSGGTFPYVLNGGTIELAGGAGHNSQLLRADDGNYDYHNITFSGSNTLGTNFKFISDQTRITDSLYITGTAIVDCRNSAAQAASFVGDGGLIMDGSTRLRIKKLNVSNPELDGINEDYILSGGTIEFYGTESNEKQLVNGKYKSGTKTIEYFNLDINAIEANYSIADRGNVGMSSSFTLKGKMDVNAPAVFKMDVSDFIWKFSGNSTNNVNIKSGAGLMYGSPYGITTVALSGTGTEASSGIIDAPIGNIRTSIRTFDPNASYGFVSTGSMISGSGLPSTVKALHVIKDIAANRVTLTNTVRADSALRMYNGHIITGTNLLELGKDVSNKGTLDYTAGYVVGNMRRWYDGINTGIASGLYPLGEDIIGVLKNRKYLIQYTVAATTGGYLDVNFKNENMGTAGISSIPQINGACPFYVTTTEDQGYWIASPQASTLSDGAYTLAITGEGFDTVNVLCEITLLKRVQSASPNWTAPGTHLSPTGSLAVPVVSRSGLSGFSNFGFGGGPQNPLPVELTSFTGSCNDGSVQINWSTATELNSSAFLIQRSENGANYSTVATIPAAGNSSQPRNYSITDEVSTNSNYYRLIEVDTDGKQTIYSFIQVRCGEVNGINIFYNEPKVVVEVNSNTDKQVGFNVYEVSGKLLHQENKQITRGYNRFDLGLKNKLADGIYIIQMTDGDKVSATKVMIH